MARHEWSDQEVQEQVEECFNDSNVLRMALEDLVECCPRCRVNVAAATLVLAMRDADLDLREGAALLRNLYKLSTVCATTDGADECSSLRN